MKKNKTCFDLIEKCVDKILNHDVPISVELMCDEIMNLINEERERMKHDKNTGDSKAV